MLSKNLTIGSSINAGKPVGVLNRLAGSGAMLAWYQDKPIEVLNKPAGNGEISGKRDLVNALLCTWFVGNDNIRIYKYTLSHFFMMSLENGCKLDLHPAI